MKKLIALISVLLVSFFVFADDELDFSGSAGFKFKLNIDKEPKAEDAKDAPAPVTTVTWADDGISAKASISKEDVSGEVNFNGGNNGLGDVWANYQYSDAFSIKLGRFGRQSCKVGDGSGKWGPAGGGQIELCFAGEAAKFYVSIFNPVPAADNAVGAIHSVREVDKKLVFYADSAALSHKAFIPELTMTFSYSADAFNVAAGGTMHTFKLVRDAEETQITSIGMAAKGGFSAGIFGLNVSVAYVMNASILGGGSGYNVISYPLEEAAGEGALVGTAFMGFGGEMSLKLGDAATAKAGMGYGINSMKIEGFQNDATVGLYANVGFKAFETIDITPQFGLTMKMQDYKGDNESSNYYFQIASKLSF